MLIRHLTFLSISDTLVSRSKVNCTANLPNIEPSSKAGKKDKNMGLMNKEVATEDTKGSKFTVKRNAMKKIVKSYLETEAGKAIPAEALEALKYLAGMGSRSQGMQIANELRELLLAGSVSSIDIFTKFGYGQPTMNKKIRDFIKAEPEHRLWVVFADGNYTVAGKGENPPRGWTGFVPVVETEL